MSSSTSNTKRRSMSPPSTPRNRWKRQNIQEREEAAENTMTYEKETYGKYVYDNDDTHHETSEETKKRLLSLQEPPRIDENLLSRLKSLLLNDNDKHVAMPHMSDLSQLIPLIIEQDRWHELDNMVLKALHADSPWRQEMALMVIVNFPGTMKTFWYNHCEPLLVRFSDLFDSMYPIIQTLTFDASVKLIPILSMGKYDKRTESLIQCMMGWVQLAIENRQGSIVETRIIVLVELVKSYTLCFMKEVVFVDTCMLTIVEASDEVTSTFLKCQAIGIIKTLNDANVRKASRIYTIFPDDARILVMENCLRLMFVIEDCLTWYKMDSTSNEFIGVSQAKSMGMFLLVKMCLHSKDQGLLVKFGHDVIPRYLNSNDWRIRQAAVSAFGAIGLACKEKDVIREQAESVLDISLNDPHPRVLCSSFEAIVNLTQYSAAKEDVGYLNKFLPRIVNIFTSNSIFPRLQFKAASVIRLLIRNCDKEVLESSMKDLTLELYSFSNLNEECHAVAMEIMAII